MLGAVGGGEAETSGEGVDGIVSWFLVCGGIGEDPERRRGLVGGGGEGRLQVARVLERGRGAGEEERR